MKYETVESVGDEGYLHAKDMWNSVFPDTEVLNKKYPWYYSNKSFPSNIYLLKESASQDIVGAIGLVSRNYNTKQGSKIAGLCSDFAVDKKHQTVAPALKLLHGLTKGAEDKCDFLIGFPGKNSFLVMRRAGFQVIGELPRYAIVLKSASYIKKIPLSGFKFLISESIDILLKLYFTISRCTSLDAYDFDEILEIDKSFDNLWAKWAEETQLFSGKRDSEYLTWRFLKNPQETFRVFSLKHHKTKALVGYVAVHVDEGGHWHINDFIALSGSNTLKILLQKLIEVAIKENAISLTIEFLGNDKVHNLLKKLRFSKRISERQVILYPFKGLSFKDELLYDVNNWYITSADELG